MSSFDSIVSETTSLLTEKSGQLKQALQEKSGQLNTFISERTDQLKSAINDQVSEAMDTLREKSDQANTLISEKAGDLDKARTAAANWAHHQRFQVANSANTAGIYARAKNEEFQNEIEAETANIHDQVSGLETKVDDLEKATTNLMKDRQGQLENAANNSESFIKDTSESWDETSDQFKESLRNQRSGCSPRLNNLVSENSTMLNNADFDDAEESFDKVNVSTKSQLRQLHEAKSEYLGKSTQLQENKSAKLSKKTTQLKGELDAVEMNLDKESQELPNLMDDNLSKTLWTADQTNDLVENTIDQKSNQIHKALDGKVTEVKDTIEETSKDIENRLQHEVNQRNAELNEKVHQLKNTINSTTDRVDNMIDDVTEQTRQKIQVTSNQFKAVISEKSDQLKSAVSHAIGNAVGGILSDSIVGSALSNGLNIAGNMISDKAGRLIDQTLTDRPPTHLELLEAKGYHLDLFELEHKGNEWLRSILENMDELNRELKSLNADMKTYDADDEEIDAGDDLVPELSKSKNSRNRKSYIAEGINLLIDYWIPPAFSNTAEKDISFSETSSKKERTNLEKLPSDTVEGGYEMSFENYLGDVTHVEDENDYEEDQRVVTKRDLKKILGKGYTHSNLNLLWRFLQRAEEKIEEGEEFPKFGTSLATLVEKPMLLSLKSFDFTHGSMKRLFSKSSLKTNEDKDEEEPIIIKPATPKGKLSSWMSFRSTHSMDDVHLPEIKENADEERSPPAEEPKHISKEENHQEHHQEHVQNEENSHPAEGSQGHHPHHMKPLALAVQSALAMHHQSSKKFGFSESNASLSSFEDDEGTIPLSIFRQFIQESSKRNLGLCLSALVLCLLKLVEHPKIPGILKEAMEIVKQLLRPLIGYTGSFGILVAIEDVREIVHEDPDELLALEAEADEEALQRRLELVKSFATDFQESFDNGFAPDPSLMMSIAIEVSTSFIGLGPSTKRRLAILQSILGLTSIEDDKKKIDTVDSNLKAEIAVIQSLPRIEKDLFSEDARNRHSAQMEHMDLLRQEQAAALKKQEEMIETLQEELKSSFDVRALLGEEGEIGDFWVHNFGKECYEVHEKRFYAALIRSYDKLDEKEWKKLRSMLMDTRGMVTAIQLQQFVGRDGSLAKVIDKFLKKNKMPRHLNDLQDLDHLDTNSSSIYGNSKKERSKFESSASSEDLRRQIASFIEKSGVTDNQNNHASSFSSLPNLSRNSSISEHEPYSLPSIDEDHSQNHKLILQPRRKSKDFFTNNSLGNNSSLPDIHVVHPHDSASSAHLFHHPPPSINTESLRSRSFSKDKSLPSPTQSSSTPLSKGRTPNTCPSPKQLSSTPMSHDNKTPNTFPSPKHAASSPHPVQKRANSISSRSSSEDSSEIPLVLQMYQQHLPAWNDHFSSAEPNSSSVTPPPTLHDTHRHTYDSFTDWKNHHKHDKDIYLQGVSNDEKEKKRATSTERRQARLRLYEPLLK